MATQIYCDPCSEDSKYLPAIRYCSDCEERLCKECVEYHSRLKSLKSHHLIDLASTGNKIPSSTKKYCEIHPDTILDFDCTQHDTPCCRTCIPINRRVCDNVLPLDLASKDVQNSSLLFDTLEKIGQINLKSGEYYNIIDIAVTADNKLLLSNYHYSFPKIYIYRDCKDYENEIQCSSKPYGITVIPDTDTAVVTLPWENAIQFINTTNMTKGNKVQIGFMCWGITATKDNIIVGGEGVVHILDRHGSKISEVTVGGSDINSLHYDKVNNRLLCRYRDGMCCVTLDGKSVYQYKVTGHIGLAVDQQGHVYLSHKPNEIHRLSSDGKFRDVVLTEDHGIKDPYALSFNNDFTKLFVVNNNWESVSVFKCM